MSLHIYVEVDTNDGDYVGGLTAASSEEIERFETLVHLSGDSLASWTEGECQDRPNSEVYPQFSENDIEFISDKMPYCEYGFHTVEKIKIVDVLNTL
ncbi:UNVERIFIED_ORG: hypothetical protein GCAPEGMB_00081 [Vibrio phage V07]|nr:hypothetical protein COHAPHLL_00138 [Vibrio phage V09]UNA01930.1 hypothetical protein [Vibrio phage PC-Liy1]URQ03227.1 hypothetical protein PVA8_241 [Vibrio phage PVA8]WBM58962.1 hypothetical protein vBValMPVA8_240 [Vibrio phage vB_ValM_PVA8]WOL24945.1 hypothetical protein [Vibrio phage PG216]